MPYKNEWYLDNRVFLTTYEGDVSLDDLRTITDEMKAFLEEGQPPVHNLVDVHRIGTYPKNVQELRTILGYISDERFGWFILIGKSDDSLVQFFIAVLSKVLGINIRFAKDFEEAEEVLNRVDSTLSIPQ